MSIPKDRDRARLLYRWLSCELATALTWRVGIDLRKLVQPVDSPRRVRHSEAARWLEAVFRRLNEVEFSPHELERLLCDLWRIGAAPIGCGQVAEVVAWLDGPTDAPCAVLPCLPKIINDAGADDICDSFAESVQRVEAIIGNVTVTPQWNRKSGVLSFNSKSSDVDVAKAIGVVRILDKFQDEGWTVRIESPFPKALGTELADLVKSLNRIAERGTVPLKFGRQKGGFYWREI